MGKIVCMREKIIAGNWKMNLSIPEGVKLVEDIEHYLAKRPLQTKVIVAPSFTHLYSINQLNCLHVKLSAQNCHESKKGAFTGEISPLILQDLGVQYVILGHSERRELFGESDALIRAKIEQCLSMKLKPIICCGESLEERRKNKHFEVVKEQLNTALYGLQEKSLKECMIAYEPVWAIGTGETASPEQAQEMHAYIRRFLGSICHCNETISILYGGSCKPSNAQAIFSQKDVDGGLIGGASLNSEDFIELINLRELM